MSAIPGRIPPADRQDLQPAQKTDNCLKDLSTKVSDFVQSRWGIVLGIGIAITLTMGIVYGALAAGVAAIAAMYFSREENSENPPAARAPAAERPAFTPGPTRAQAAAPRVFTAAELGRAEANFQQKLGNEDPESEAAMRENLFSIKNEYAQNPIEFAKLCQALTISMAKGLKEAPPEAARFVSPLMTHLENNSLEFFDVFAELLVVQMQLQQMRNM